MRLPKPLFRRNKDVHKNTFGHLLVVAGSPRMLGASALTGLSAMRSGAGLVTLAVPQSLNLTLQKKISNTIMTLPLKETKEGTFSAAAALEIVASAKLYTAIAIGPGLSQHASVKRFIKQIISKSPIPLIIDADALNLIADDPGVLLKTRTSKIITPHPGEMARLMHTSRQSIEKKREDSARTFAKKYNCTVLLKGHKTVIASPQGKIKLNPTGNAGMATAGSGDVLTGMIAAFVAQGIMPFEAGFCGAYLHGMAGDLAADKLTKTSMIATDIIDFIPSAFKKALRS
jgi:NAD(P)H-hydrate epimerase